VVSKGPCACTETLSFSAYSAYLWGIWEGDRRDSNPRPSEPQSDAKVSLVFAIARKSHEYTGFAFHTTALVRH
jgi:hypothetical protein